jgi:hypothetical protein
MRYLALRWILPGLKAKRFAYRPPEDIESGTDSVPFKLAESLAEHEVKHSLTGRKNQDQIPLDLTRRPDGGAMTAGGTVGVSVPARSASPCSSFDQSSRPMPARIAAA